MDRPAKHSEDCKAKAGARTRMGTWKYDLNCARCRSFLDDKEMEQWNEK